MSRVVDDRRMSNLMSTDPVTNPSITYHKRNEATLDSSPLFLVLQFLQILISGTKQRKWLAGS